MNSMEVSLVIFTILAQWAVGLMLFKAATCFSPVAGAFEIKWDWHLAVVFLALGLIASVFHLGHPLSAPRAITNLGTAWLSREILVFLIFGGLLLVGIFTKTRGAGLIILTAGVGLLGLIVSSLVYSPPGLPAINNGLPFVFFLLTAALLGSAFSSYLLPETHQGLARGLLIISLTVALVVYLSVPGVWLAGTTPMHQTGLNFYSSTLYWLHLVIGLALPLVAVVKFKTIPVWAPPLVLLGEIMARLIFFSHVVHASTAIGAL